jgi:hypothetical protein
LVNTRTLGPCSPNRGSFACGTLALVAAPDQVVISDCLLARSPTNNVFLVPSVMSAKRTLQLSSSTPGTPLLAAGHLAQESYQVLPISVRVGLAVLSKGHVKRRVMANLAGFWTF